MINLLLSGLQSHVAAEQKYAVDTISDFVRIAAGEEGVGLPVSLPPELGAGRKLLAHAEGMPVYLEDFLTRGDIRITWRQRLRQAKMMRACTSPSWYTYYVFVNQVTFRHIVEAWGGVTE